MLNTDTETVSIPFHSCIWQLFNIHNVSEHIKSKCRSKDTVQTLKCQKLVSFFSLHTFFAPFLIIQLTLFLKSLLHWHFCELLQTPCRSNVSKAINVSP